MTDLRQTAQQALEFLDAEFGWSPGEAPRIDALRAALAQQADPTDPGHDVDVLREHVRHLERRIRELHAQRAEPAQEPVGVVTSMVKGGVTWHRWPSDMPDGTKLYTAPPQRKPLTDEEIAVLEAKYAPPVHPDFADSDDWVDLIRAVERAHGIGEGA